jgi:hypothetical protein
MEYFWAVIVTLVIVMIIWGIIASKLRQRRMKRATEAMLPSLKQHFEAGRRYNVFLSHGQMFERVRFLGMSEPFDRGHRSLPFPLCQWIVVERESGQQLYIKPESIRYYEDADIK